MGPAFLTPLSLPLPLASLPVVAVLKPAGMLVHNSAFAGPREPSLAAWVGEQLGRPVHALHRLDRATSGVVLFVREATEVAAWGEALSSSQKTYIGIVRGRTLDPGVIDHPVKSDRGERKDAVTRVVEVLRSPTERCSRVVLEPLTGRHHQLRQHLKHRSHPLLLDSNYGDLKENRRIRAAYGLERLALHCWRIALVGPGGDRWVFEAPLPDDLEAFLAAVGLPGGEVGFDAQPSAAPLPPR